jgi:hypothetical protein
MPTAWQHLGATHFVLVEIEHGGDATNRGRGHDIPLD